MRLWLKAESDELLHLDLLRFVASMLIVLYHFGRFTTWSALRAIDGFSLAVDLFFVISGYVIAHVYDGRLKTLGAYSVFLLRRLARLAPLHWLTLAFFVGLGVLAHAGKLHTDHFENYEWSCLVPTALALNALGLCGHLSFNFVSWSISAEMGMYLISPILLALGGRRRWIALALCIVVTATLSALGTSVGGRPWFAWTFGGGVARALPEFLLGVVLFAFRGALMRIPMAPVLMTGFLFTYLVGSIAAWPLPVLLPLVYGVVIFGIASDAKGRARGWVARLGALGQLTYSVYMLHPIILTVGLSVVGRRFLKLHGAAADLWVLAMALLTLAVGFLSFRFFETPTRQLIGNWVRRKTLSTGAFERKTL